MRPDGGAPRETPPPISIARHERSSLSTWLIAAVSLVAGILIGFGSGYQAGRRSEAAAGQTFTETAVTGEAVPAPVAVDPEPIVPTREPEVPAATEKVIGQPKVAPPASTPQRPAQRTPPVERAATGPGSLQVLSRPAGAQVRVDGRVIGRTPLVVPDVSVGTHDVRLELQGFRGWATSVEVAPGQRTRVAASLEQ